MPCASFDEVFRATVAQSADFGIVPVENSTEGVVSRSLDLLLQSPVTIAGFLSFFGTNWARLTAAGVEVNGEIGQEDFGWYFSYRAGGASYCFVLGHRETDPPEEVQPTTS